MRDRAAESKISILHIAWRAKSVVMISRRTVRGMFASEKCGTRGDGGQKGN